MPDMSNQQAKPILKNRYGCKKSKRAKIQSFTLRSQKQNPKHITDLEWRIKFTQMKLNLWRDLENHQWEHLDILHKTAKKELRAQRKMALAGVI